MLVQEERDDVYSNFLL